MTGAGSDKSDVRASATRHLWNPMARMAAVVGNQRVLVRGHGSTIWDEDGREYIDAQGSLWYANVGYGREEIAASVARQLGELHAYGLFGDVVTPPPAKLARRLSQYTPTGIDHFFFTSGGSEAVETAFKIARQYHRLQGAPDRVKIISRRGSYHGVSYGALSATGTRRNRSGFEPLAPGFVQVPALSFDALQETVEYEGPETIAAIITEPVMGAAGVVFPPSGYLEAIRSMCSDLGILWIADEVICGFGRMGYWFGVEHWGLVPDMITMAKGISSGYMPLGAVAVGNDVYEPFLDADNAANGFFHGYTYSGHAGACAAAEANLDIIEREELLAHSAAQGSYLAERLLNSSAIAKRSVDIRAGVGLLAGIELAVPTTSAIAVRVARTAYDLGVLVRPMTGNTLTLSPPLVITRSEIDHVVDVIGRAIDENLGSVHGGA